VLLAAADAAAQRQRNAAVSRLLEKAAVIAPADSNVQVRRASLAFAERKYDAAKAILLELLRRDPGNVGARLALARVSEASGDVAGSRAALEGAIKAHPDAIEPPMMLAALELRAGKSEAASKVLDQLVDNSKGATAPNAAGLLLAGVGRIEEARTRFRKAIDRDPTNAAYWFNLGEAQLALKDAAAAKESFLRSAELQPDSLRAGVAAVRISIELKDLAAGRRVAEVLVAKLPASSTSWLLLGEVRAAGGDIPGAADAFAQSYAARANALAATREFGARVATGMQRPEEPLLKWLARAPTDAATRMVLANFYLLRNSEDQAREQLEVVITQKPSDVAALNNLAWVLRASAPARAESLARRARAIAPDNAAVSDTLGVILLTNGKTGEAVALLQQAATSSPDDPGIQYHYAWSLSKAGQKDMARSILGKALHDPRPFPDRTAAQRLYKELG
jgi:putative PEP-CTERM system TPR-repeat lipoprotein